MLSFNNEIKTSDLLTTFAILVSASAFLYSWSSDRALQIRHQADIVRIACAATVEKIDRWEELTLSIFDRMQPSIVEATEIVVAGDTNSLVKARDFLWKDVNRIRSQVQQDIRNENIESAYSAIFPYSPAMRTDLKNIIDGLELIQIQMFDEILGSTESAILHGIDTRKPYQTAELGNSLRATLAEKRQKFIAEFQQKILWPEAILGNIVSMSDTKLAAKKKTYDLLVHLHK
jgi:hypothetical protein